MNGVEIAARALELVATLAEIASEALAVQNPADMKKVQDALKGNSIKAALLAQEAIAAGPVDNDLPD